MRILLPAVCLLLFAVQRPYAQSSGRRVEPSMKSLHPFTVQPGSTAVIEVRGTGLSGAHAVAADARLRIVPEATGDTVKLRVDVPSDLQPGRYPFRLITSNGISNALPLHVTDLPTIAEPAGDHDTAATAIPVPALPALFNARLTRRGETDYYTFRAEAGQLLTFEVISGYPQIAATGSAATVPNFDPSLAIFETGASWFDAQRLKRIAFNDEPMWVLGRVTDAHLVHRFARAGTYLLRVAAFAGQGGPDYSYHLKIVSGERAQDLPSSEASWQERGFTRKLAADRLSSLAARGGAKTSHAGIETFRADAEAAVFKLPGTLEGALSKPGEAHRARFRIDGAKDIAIEVETPQTAPPYFNPLVRLLNESGDEVSTNVMVGKGACTGALTKSLQSKVLVPLREPGEYTLEIRELTPEQSGSRYRVQIRQQVPHLGDVRIDVDHLNLTPGEAKAIKVTFDGEEGFRGGIAIAAEDLPPGVSAFTGGEFDEERDIPEPSAKRERFVARPQKSTLVLTAASGALPEKEARTVRLVARPMVNGQLGEVIAVKRIPVMVVAKQ